MTLALQWIGQIIVNKNRCIDCIVKSHTCPITRSGQTPRFAADHCLFLNLESSIMKLKFPCRERMDAGTSNPNANASKLFNFFGCERFRPHRQPSARLQKKRSCHPTKKSMKKDGAMDGIEDSWNLKESSWSIDD